MADPMVAYWWGVHRVALRRAWSILGVTGRGIVFGAITAAAIVFALVYAGSPDAYRDEIITRSAFILTPLVVFPFLYLWFFVKAPTDLHNELSATLKKKIGDLEENIKELNANAVDQTVLRLRSSSLSILIQNGLNLAHERIALSEFDGWKAHVQKWELNGLSFLRSNVSAQDALDFNTVLYENVRNYIYKINNEHNVKLNELVARINVLKTINSRYQQYWATMTPQWRAIVEAHLANFKGE